jgi:LuxR family maltose regulon positive regulatory protein
MVAGTQGSAAAKTAQPPPVIPLATKLAPPMLRRRLVARPRLVARLNIEPLPKVMLVDAPPGWGKTTLVTEWIASQGASRRFAWLALDRDDNDPARFWTYAIEALRTVLPELGDQALAWLRVPGTDAVETALPSVINELEACDDEIVLVIDDYHLVTNGVIQDGIEFLVEHLPSTLRVVLITRSDPRLPLALLRGRGELVEVRAQELRFTEEEAVSFLNDALGLELGPQQVAQLQGRTEGWAAGLQLAALSLRGQSDASRFIAAFAGDDRHVVDYLGSEVLGGLPPAVRRFLLRTSILDRLCADLCDAVTEDGGSARMLERIERENLFFVPLDATRRWYRYHHLFGELLCHELEQTEPELVETLHRRASTWLEAEGLVSDAIRHATLGDDVDRAADLIALHWSSFLQRGQLDTVSRWLDGLPPDAVVGDARLCLTRAWIAVNQGRIGDIDTWIEAAHRATALSGTSDDADWLNAAAGMLRCIHRYMEGDVGSAIQAAEHARELEPHESAPWRSVGCPVLGVSLFWRGESEGAAGTLEGAVARARAAGNHLAVIHAHSCLAAIHAERGAMDTADHLAQVAIDLGADRGLDEHWANAMAHVARGKLLEQRGLLPEAEASLYRAVELSRRGIAKAEIGYCLLAYARARHERGAQAQARELVTEARLAIESCPDPGVLVEMLVRTERGLRLAARRAPLGAGSDELTDRELEVLRLLRSELSLREIGSELYVSLNTVKSHSKSIYRKLDASSREEAIAAARELGLV